MIKYELERYDDYKKTDSYWFNEAPLHWISGRVKDFVDTNALTKVPMNLADDDLVEFVPMTNVDDKTGKIKQFNFVPLKEVSSGYTKFRNRDIIFAKITPCMENGNCAIVSSLTYDICFGSTEFMVFRAIRKLSEKYLHYFLHNDLFRRNAEPFMKGSAGQKRISSHYMFTHYFALPPIPEQNAIADYLDTKTTKIDEKIDLLTKKADKYTELKQSLINETVTRGLDKTVAMKDSGVEWIGEVPEHWNVKRTKACYKYRKEINKNFKNNNVLALTYAGVINKDTSTNMGLLPTSYETYQIFYKNDLAFKLIDLANIKTSRVGIVHQNGIMSPVYIRLQPGRNIFSRFFFYLYTYYYKINLFNYLGGAGVRSSLTYNELLNIPVSIPPYEEQKAISDYLDMKTAHIDRIIETINDQIEKLKELRKTLINDVVTGKIKVYKEGETV